jgi:hypothetical protein
MKVESRKRKTFAVAPSNGAMAQQVRLCRGRFGAKMWVASKAAMKAFRVAIFGGHSVGSVPPVRFRVGLPAILSAEAAWAKDEAVAAKAGQPAIAAPATAGRTWSHSVAVNLMNPRSPRSRSNRVKVSQTDLAMVGRMTMASRMTAFSRIFPGTPTFSRFSQVALGAKRPGNPKSRLFAYFSLETAAVQSIATQMGLSRCRAGSCQVVLNRAKK